MKQAAGERSSIATTRALDALGSEESEEGRELLWDTEQADRYLDRYWEAPVSSEPFHPGETGVRSLRAGEGHVCDAWRSSGRRREAHLDALVAYELLAGAPVYSAAPVLPEQRSRTHRERMQQHADLAWLFGRVAMPLALFAQGAGAAAADTGRVHDAQAAIGFSTPFMSKKRLPCWTPERPIGLERKVRSSETPRFEGSGSGRWTASRGRSG